MSAMSRLKSPHRMYVWFGCAEIWLVMVVLRWGMRRMSSKCVGMYMWIISQGVSGWLFIFIICRYGDIFAGVGTLVMLPGNAYLL